MSLTLRFSGDARGLWPIVLRNVFLNLLTLTIYRFWGKTDVRRYLWRNAALAGDPFEYTGTGKELFLGFLIAVFLVLLPFALVTQGVPQFLPLDHPLVIVIGLLTYPTFMFLFGVAMYRARRYRLTRTLWRGVRGRLTGSPSRYGLFYLLCFVFNVFTLGFAYPWTRSRLFARLIGETAFGDHRFLCEPTAKRLYGPFMLTVLLGFIVLVVGIVISNVLGSLLVPHLISYWELEPGYGVFYSLGILAAQGLIFLAVMTVLGAVMIVPFAYYKVREYAHLIGLVEFPDTRFRFVATMTAFVKLYAGNLGFGYPFAQMRVLRFYCQHLEIDGSPDLEAIRRSVSETPAFGEGLADAFDIDVF